MYFIQYQPLKDKLRSRSVSDREALPYYIVYTAIATFSCALPHIDNYTIGDAVLGFLAVLGSIVGTLYVYRKNGGKAGFDLILKLYVLGWIVFIRFFIPAAIITFIVGTMLCIIGTTINVDCKEFFQIFMLLFIIIIYFQRLGRHIKDTAIDKSMQTI